jgi:CRP/FNR family transcriptional regulator
MSNRLEQADRLACSECSLNKPCVPAGLSREDMHEFEQIVHKSRPIQAGEFVFRRGDPFSSVAAVRSGCFKSFIIDENASEHVLGFHFPGDLLRLDAIHKKNTFVT